MRVHPAPPPPPPRHHTITLRYNTTTTKNLRRLPHIFEKVLELPFRSDADVAVSETPSCLVFSVDTEYIDTYAYARGDGEEVWADAVEICPGVTKVVVRGGGLATASESEVDTWRFRLPEYTRPEMATAEYGEGGLVVTVPKEEEERERGLFLYSD